MELDLDLLEALALAPERSLALAALLPGTALHDYWRGVHLQHEGRLDEVDPILAAWSAHHDDDELKERLARRQLLLRAGEDLAAHAEALRIEAEVSLDDQAEAEVAAQRYPTRLDPALLDEDRLIDDALSRSDDLTHITDWAAGRLVARAATFERPLLHDFFRRLQRTNVPGVVELVARAIDHPGSRGFRDAPLHQSLTRDQLLALAAILPSLRQDGAWVSEVLARHDLPEPTAGQSDDEARRDYLDGLWAFVEPLALSFNSLKAQVLFHRLDLDRRLGTFDRARLLRYLDLPSDRPFVDRRWLRSFPTEQRVDAGDRISVPGLAPRQDDSALLLDYLHHFLAREGVDAFADRLQRDWLDQEHATARLLAGDPDTRRWTTILSTPALAALRERVDIDLSPRNPTRFGADDAVTLEVFVKNVPELQIKVFRIDALAYFQARGDLIDTSVDLDGMIAGDERTLRLDAPAIQRTRVTLDLPACARAGTYVVELLGNGKSSRALIRKGALRHTGRVGAAGLMLSVFDETGRFLPDARAWMAGREYLAREDGEIAIPFSTRPDSAPMLLIHGDLVERASGGPPAEAYDLEAGLDLDRQALVAGKTARLLLRPELSIASTPLPIALLEEPRVEITVTDLAGLASTKVESVVLRDDREAVIEFQVPEDASRIGIRLRGRVRAISTQQTIELEAGADAEVNLVDRSARTEVMHLATTEAGHVLHLLGKSGEPRAGRAIALSFKHAAVDFDVTVTLSTDERGRIELGPLPGVERVTAGDETWSVWPDVQVPRWVHAEAGAAITLPAPPFLAQDADLALAVSLQEGVGRARLDRTDRVRLERRALVITGLEPGRYRLLCRGWRSGIDITVVERAVERSRGWSITRDWSVELSPPLPVIRTLAVESEQLVVRISNAGADTRVHAIATLFRPSPALAAQHAWDHRAPDKVSARPTPSSYVSGRDLGDEHRYILDRRTAARRPGMLIEKPSLLRDPWALRTTSTALQTAADGSAYGAMMRTAGDPRGGGGPGGIRRRSSPTIPLASFDFLAAPAVVIANLRPDADGVLRIPLADLCAAQLVQIVVVDPALTTTAELALPEIAPAHRDRRLRLALDSQGHFAEDRRVEPLPAGTTIVVDDVRTGKLELVDTIARAHQVLLTLGNDDALREFAFITKWPDLDAAEQQRKYSHYACHELNLFLAQKDPAFFARVVRPTLAHKLHPTFLDRYLVGDDLRDYLDPWAFDRLNTLERVLLARRVPEARAAITRLVGDIVDCIPPDPARDAELVDTLLGAAGLEGDRLGAAAEVSIDALMEARSIMADESPKAKKSMSRSRGGGDDDDEASMGAMPPSPAAAPMAAAPPPRAPAMLPGSGGGGRAERDGADLRERERGITLFRSADRTEEWAETAYWRKRIEDTTPDLIPPSRFLRDLARHESGPFLSPHLGECASSFAAALTALALLDLPFTAAAHAIVVDDTRLTLTAASHALAARTRITAIALPAAPSPILVGQSYVRADDASTWDGAEQREKYVTGELLIGVVYQCRITVTNPTSAAQRLDVLLQIPRGAVPVESGFLTKTRHLHLGPYGTEALAYSFYFPLPGRFEHFPAHVIRKGELCAFAAPTTLDVVREATAVDAGSWPHVSQHATIDEVLAFLDRENLGRIDLARIAWRLRDRDAFTRVTALLAARHAYDDRLWSYALLHADRPRAAEWLRHQDELLRVAGPALEGGLAPIDPVARGDYQHLEYAPLVNARAHTLGKRRRILNDALATQYRSFLDVVAHRARPGDAELLAAAHYAFCLDRVDEALALLDRVRPERVTARLQLGYLSAYAACCRGDLTSARSLASPWIDHPVDRWRARFVALVAMLDEAEGKIPAAIATPDAAGPANRDRTIAELAARQPTLDLVADHGQLVVQHQNLATCQLRFYRMDIELLFSRQPFVQGDVERFSWIDPGCTLDLALGEGGRTPVPIPESMRGENLVVDAVAAGQRRSIAHYAHDLGVEIANQYGQLRVLRASTGSPLPAAYVKVYARQRGGADEIAFYKDGYTDLRGRFDYATLSTDDLDRVERFALLIVSSDAGATVLEAPPPAR